MPHDFEILPDSCCSETISIENVTYPGAICHLTMNARIKYYKIKLISLKFIFIISKVCYARKYVKVITILGYVYQSLYCYYISLLWSLSFISVLTFDQSTIDLDISA